MKAAAAAVLRLSHPTGTVRLHPRRPDGGHLGEDDRGGGRTAAQLLQQDHHAGTKQPDALGEAVQGEGTLEDVLSPGERHQEVEEWRHFLVLQKFLI